MKAIVVSAYGGPDKLELKEIQDPDPGQGEILLAIKSAGINPVDTYHRSGTMGYAPELPFTPGLDGAGIIIECGKGVNNFSPGDRIYCGGSLTGTYAEKAICRENQVHSLPENSSFSSGAALHVPYATAYYALFIRGDAQAGETVLIHGASGAVGIAAVQWALQSGLQVIGTAGSPRGIRLLENFGTHLVVDHTADDYQNQISSFAGTEGIPLVIEMLANVNLQNDMDFLSSFGRVVVVGNRGTTSINPRTLMTKNASIRGMTLLNATEKELQHIHSQIYDSLKKGEIDPIIQNSYPLSEAGTAHREVIESPSCGKIVLDISE